MLRPILAMAALMPLAAAQASCPRWCSEITLGMDLAGCIPPRITRSCQTICTDEYTNNVTFCRQCSLNRDYSRSGFSYGNGGSLAFDMTQGELVELHGKCALYGTVPTATVSLTEPPLPYPTPTEVAGRPRDCNWLCYDANAHGDAHRHSLIWGTNFFIESCYLPVEPDSPQCKPYSSFCSADSFNKVAECAQCRFISTSSRDWYNKPDEQAFARARLDELIVLCRDLGRPVTDVPLYTQFPIPTDTQLALSVTPTTTHTRRVSTSLAAPTTPTTPTTPPGSSATVHAAAARLSHPAYAAPVAAVAAGLYIMA